MFTKNTSSLTSPFVCFEGEGGGNGGTTTTEPPVWHEQLDSSLKGNEALSQYKGVNELAQKHIELGKEHTELRGKVEGMVHIPKDGSSVEEIAAYRKAIGVPEKADDYKLNLSVQVPESLPDYLKESAKAEIDAYGGMIRNLAHEAGLPQAAADKFYNSFIGHLVGAFEKRHEEFQSSENEAMETLQKEWKNETDSRIKESVRVAEILEKHVPGFKQYFEDSGIGNHVPMIKAMDFLRTKVLDDTAGTGHQGGKEPRKMADGTSFFEFKGLDK